jgi:type III secretion protein T
METMHLTHILETLPLVFARTAAAFWTLPFLDKQVLSGYIKNSIVFALILPLVVVVPVEIKITRNFAFLMFIGILLKEAFIGFLIGLIIGIVFWAAQNAGDFIDMQRGAFYAIFFDPLLSTQATPFGNLFFRILIVLFFIHGGFVEMIRTVFTSYTVWPINDFLPIWNMNLAALMAGTLTRLGRLLVAISAPVILACFSVDLGMGLINRFTPSLNVFIISLPIKSALAVFMIAVYSSFLMPFFDKQFLVSEQIITMMKAIFQ